VVGKVRASGGGKGDGRDGTTEGSEKVGGAKLDEEGAELERRSDMDGLDTGLGRVERGGDAGRVINVDMGGRGDRAGGTGRRGRTRGCGCCEGSRRGCRESLGSGGGEMDRRDGRGRSVRRRRREEGSGGGGEDGSRRGEERDSRTSSSIRLSLELVLRSSPAESVRAASTRPEFGG
jgi:hypothetical protein